MHWRQDASLSGHNILNMGIWYEAMSRWLGPAKRVSVVTKISVPRRRDSSGVMQDVRVPDHVDILATFGGGARAHLRFSSVTALAPPPEAWLFGTEGTLRLEANARRLSGGRRGDKALSEIAIPDDPANRLARRGGVRRCHPRHRDDHAHDLRGRRALHGVHRRGDQERGLGAKRRGRRPMTGEAALSVEHAAQVRDRFATPCYVYVRGALEAAARRALAFPAPFGLTVRYAMKANPSRGVLELFRGLGLHVDASATTRSSARCAPASPPARSSSRPRCPRAGSPSTSPGACFSTRARSTSSKPSAAPRQVNRSRSGWFPGSAAGRPIAPIPADRRRASASGTSTWGK